MKDPSDAVQEFAAALSTLFEAAGNIEAAQIVHRGKSQRPEVRLKAQTVSDWLVGKSVPSPDSLRGFQFLVQELGKEAAKRGNAPQPWHEWIDLLNAARAAKKARATPPKRPRRPPVQRLGRPISEYSPIDLEVHRAIEVPGQRPDLPVLPPFIRRRHDAELEEVVLAAAAGNSCIAVMVGGSSTGKTRACWEAIQGLPAEWNLWYPIDPSRSDAAAEALDLVGPKTVIWLNEAQHYLMPGDVGVGERVCAKLRTLLRTPSRGPVLIVATMWPNYWNALTAQAPDGQPDPYAQARALLRGNRILVPDTFLPADMDLLRDTGAVDPRLLHAADHAVGGRITQYLAGVPALLDRYHTAPPAARAVIDAAIDARRLGHPAAIPHLFLQQAAPGYFTDQQWDDAPDDWLERALHHSAAPCNGVPGPLTRIRPRPSEPSLEGGPFYRLADYLEQTGRTARATVFPPASFWDAVAHTVTNPEVLTTIGAQAAARGRFHRAAQLYRTSAEHGDNDALLRLANLRERAGDQIGAEQLYREAGKHGNTYALSRLAKLRERAGDHATAEQLAREAAKRGNTSALSDLADLRERAGDHATAEQLAREAAERGGTYALSRLAELRERAGDYSRAEQLAREAAEHGSTYALSRLAVLRERDVYYGGAKQLYREAAKHGDPYAIKCLADLRERAGDHAGAEQLHWEAAKHGSIYAMDCLAELRERAGDHAGAEKLAREAAKNGSSSALSTLAELREEAGNHVAAEQLAREAAKRGDTSALSRLAVRRRERVGDHATAEQLAREAALHGNTAALSVLTELWEEAGDHARAEQLAREAAKHGDRHAMKYLADLRERAGDHATAEQLAREAAERGDPAALTRLAELRDRTGHPAGAEQLAREAVDRGGDTEAIARLAALLERAGQPGVRELRSYGVTDNGAPATGLSW